MPPVPITLAVALVGVIPIYKRMVALLPIHMPGAILVIVPFMVVFVMPIIEAVVISVMMVVSVMMIIVILSQDISRYDQSCTDHQANN